MRGSSFSVWRETAGEAILHLSSFPSIYFLVFYGHRVVTCGVSTRKKTSYWKSMACNLGTFTLLRAGTCLHTVAIGWFQIESSCCVFRLNYLKRRGRKKELFFFSFVSNYELRDEEIMYLVSWFLASLITSRLWWILSICPFLVNNSFSATILSKRSGFWILMYELCQLVLKECEPPLYNNR